MLKKNKKNYWMGWCRCQWRSSSTTSRSAISANPVVEPLASWTPGRVRTRWHHYVSVYSALLKTSDHSECCWTWSEVKRPFFNLMAETPLLKPSFSDYKNTLLIAKLGTFLKTNVNVRCMLGIPVLCSWRKGLKKKKSTVQQRRTRTQRTKPDSDRGLYRHWQMCKNELSANVSVHVALPAKKSHACEATLYKGYSTGAPSQSSRTWLDNTWSQ